MLSPAGTSRLPSCLSSPGRSSLITSLRRTAGQRRPRSCISRPLLTTCSIQARTDSRGSFSGTWPALCFLPPRSTSYLQPCDVAVFRSFKSCIQAQASATLSRSVIDGSFDGLTLNKAWRGQSSAYWASRAATDLCEKNHAWTTGWSRLRAHSNDEFEAAVVHATEPHAEGELFSTCVEPGPALEDPVDWAMAEASDDEDVAPSQTRRPNRRSSACHQQRRLHVRCRTWSAASLCASSTALDHAESLKTCPTIIISHRLSVVSRVRCPVCPVCPGPHVFPRPDHLFLAPRQ